AAARALRRRAFPRGSRVPGDGRSPEFPGALHPASSVEWRFAMRRGGEVPPLAARASGEGSAEPRLADRMEHQRRAEKDESRLDRAAEREEVVGVVAVTGTEIRPARRSLR